MSIIARVRPTKKDKKMCEEFSVFQGWVLGPHESWQEVVIPIEPLPPLGWTEPTAIAPTSKSPVAAQAAAAVGAWQAIESLLDAMLETGSSANETFLASELLHGAPALDWNRLQEAQRVTEQIELDEGQGAMPIDHRPSVEKTYLDAGGEFEPEDGAAW